MKIVLSYRPPLAASLFVKSVIATPVDVVLEAKITSITPSNVTREQVKILVDLGLGHLNGPLKIKIIDFDK